MFSKEIVVRCESGLHNKQATFFVQKANEFESRIWIELGSRKMNAKSLLGVLSLGIVGGKVAVAIGKIAGGIEHRLQSQSLHCGHGRLQPLCRYGGRGAGQGHPVTRSQRIRR